MYKKFAVLVCVFVCLLGTTGVRAQSVFYSNTGDTFFYSPLGYEVAMPIAFSGSYEVDSFTFGYFLPLDSPNGPTTDVIVSFYTAAQPVGDAFSGYDPGQQYYPNLLSSTRLTNLPSDSTGATNVVSYDLTTFGNFFQWDAMPLISGETGGWVSLQFTNPDAGWENATGDSQDDFFQDMTNGDFLFFGGVPQAAFYIEIAGVNLIPQAPPPDVPEPGTAALLAGLLAPTAMYLRHRNRRRKEATACIEDTRMKESL